MSKKDEKVKIGNKMVSVKDIKHVGRIYDGYGKFEKAIIKTDKETFETTDESLARILLNKIFNTFSI